MNIKVELTFSSEQELLAFFARAAGSPALTVHAPAPAAPAEAPKPEAKKTKPAPAAAPVEPAPAPAPAVQEAAPAVPPTSPPVAVSSDPPAPAASAPAEQPKAAPAPAAPVKYEDSGIPSAVPTYLGKPGSDGYDARRTALVGLLGKYGVASAKLLPPEKYADFLADMKAL